MTQRTPPQDQLRDHERAIKVEINSHHEEKAFTDMINSLMDCEVIERSDIKKLINKKDLARWVFKTVPFEVCEENDFVLYNRMKYLSERLSEKIKGELKNLSS